MALTGLETVAVMYGTVVGAVGVDYGHVGRSGGARESGAAFATMAKIYDEANAEEINALPEFAVPPFRPVKPQVHVSGAVARCTTRTTAPALGASVLCVDV